MSEEKNPNGLQVIRTARTEKEINEAARKGYHPLMKKVVPSSKIASKYAIFQHKDTGEIRREGDFRGGYRKDENWEKVIDWTWYYPYHFQTPFAAYLIPPGLEEGSRVWLEDLIEDLVGTHWNQGDTSRLAAAEAIWNGEEFEIQYDPFKDMTSLIG